MLLINTSHIPWKSKSTIVLNVFSSVFPLKVIVLGKDLFNQQIQEHLFLTVFDFQGTVYIYIQCTY